MAKKSTSSKATTKGKKRVTFNFAMGNGAEAVNVTGDFCDWKADAYPMKKGKDGCWKKMVYLEPGQYEYRFVVDGDWQSDPEAPESVPNDFGTTNSVVTVEA